MDILNPETLTPNPTIKKHLEFGSGAILQRSPSFPPPELLQNCDLPPPQKLFSPILDDSYGGKINLITDDGGAGPGLRRALQLSQTRAREAEKEVYLARRTNQQLSRLLLDEALTLGAHRRWVKLLEIEISSLRRDDDGGDENGNRGNAGWCLAFALCLSIAGIGFVLGRCLF